MATPTTHPKPDLPEATWAAIRAAIDAFLANDHDTEPSFVAVAKTCRAARRDGCIPNCSNQQLDAALKHLADAGELVPKDAIPEPALAKRAVTDGTRPVITHGDFQRKNLIITNSGEVIPVDWGDFGIAHQTYAIANLVFGLDASNAKQAVYSYLDKRGVDFRHNESFFTVGMAICTVLRAGSQFRHISRYGITQEHLSNLLTTFDVFASYFSM